MCRREYALPCFSGSRVRRLLVATGALAIRAIQIRHDPGEALKCATPIVLNLVECERFIKFRRLGWRCNVHHRLLSAWCSAALECADNRSQARDHRVCQCRVVALVGNGCELPAVGERKLKIRLPQEI